MIIKFLILFICTLISSIQSRGQVSDLDTNNISQNGVTVNDNNQTEESVTAVEIPQTSIDLVKIQLYYESLCPDCRKFDSRAFKKTVLELYPYLDIHLYPYGNARTVDNGGGKYSFICQHGPAECYGNKLHACAIDIFENITLAVLFNSCLMDQSQAGNGSDDAAADVCGSSMFLNVEAIKQCAKSARGTELLKVYGDESKKEGFKSVPHILINGAPGRDDHFKEDVCKAFKNPPLQCKQ